MTRPIFVATRPGWPAMVAAGEPDGGIEAYGRDGGLRYTVQSLHAFARRSLTENPRLTLIRHQDMPVARLRNGVLGRSETLDDE